MSEPTVSGESFGQAFADALGTGPSRNTLNAQRAAIFELTQRFEEERRAQRLRRVLPWAVAGTTLAAAAGVVLTLGLHRGPVEATFAGRRVGEATELSAVALQELSFSDGSQVMLAPATRAVVTRVARDRADLRLNEGHISASIQKKTGITWTIGAGPYSVRVVGTRFSVDWQRSSETLKVSVSEGRVRVFGGDLGSEGIALDAGASLERHHGAPVVAHPNPATISQPAPKPEHAGAEPVSEPSAAPPPPPTTTRVESNANGGNAWLGLASKGKYREALQVAEKQGFSELVTSLPENDLVTLANAARFSGNSARAHQALNALRQRFAGRPGAELAALYLARTAEDLDKKPAEAARWLRVFLSESPHGDLAAGARANLMGLLLRSGDTEGARGVARDYLRYHPSGPHAAEARALTSQAREAE
ncbi:MAG: FecR domain-containing protein [Myxococcota bacterium]